MIATQTKHSVNVANGEPAWEVATLFPAQGAWSEEEYLSLEGPKTPKHQNPTT